MAAQTQSQTIHSHGIYHGLPTYPGNSSSDPNYNNLTAIITGANGISGHYMLRVLSQSPQRWSKIYCLSRRPPLIPNASTSTNVMEHIALDFLKDPEEIARVLRDRHVDKVDHVFFFSYIQPPPKEGKGLWSDADEMVRVNVLLLKNFLGALKMAGVKPKRFMLQTGAKNYGGHLGPTKVPQEESDPRVELEPNFYYPQEDAVWDYCRSENVGWNIAMPGPILGAVPDAAMNAAFPLAVYATVCARLGEPMEFPGDLASWAMPQSMSSSMLNAYMEEWAVLTPEAKDQKFNTWDNSAFTWEACWPRVAGWYGVAWKGPEEDPSVYTTRETWFTPRGYGGKGVVRARFSMVAWAKQTKVMHTWSQIAQENELTDKELRDVDRVFAFLDGSLCRAGPLYMSSDKARKLGWHGFVDSSESLLEVFRDLARLKMVPKVPEVDVKFN